MKTTVKLSSTEAICIEPVGLDLKITFRSLLMSIDRTLTPDQANAIGFGIDQAMTVVDMRREAAQNAADPLPN